ncbi:MAG: Gfo/Idh/MocA family oxidoreductase [bacterium]|nr:Gfo/Idh/MocA family oxidoreductase [bacterium]
MNKLRWGIIGAGNIAQSFAADLKYTKNSILYAIASKSGAKLNLYKKYNYKVAYNDYDQLFSDPNVDIVYIATPHSLHYENAISALKHKKHVLCEKPFAVNRRQTEDMFALAKKNKCFIMEAMWTRFLPAMQEIVKLIKNDSIGNISQIYADFCFKSNCDLHPRLFKPELAGGSLLDVGIYPIMLAYSLSGIPDEIVAAANLNKDNIDTQIGIVLKYKNKSISNLSCSIANESIYEALIYGTEGSIRIHKNWWQTKSFTLNTYTNKKTEKINEKYAGIGYQFEIDHCAECISKGLLESPVHSHLDTLNIVDILDKIRKIIGVKYPLIYE